MKAIIPDTLEGALILSLIDFFLSFVVISFIGAVLATFPSFLRAGAWLRRSRSHAAAENAPQPAPAAAVQDEIPLEHVAVITAALASVLGSHRIVHIDTLRHGGEWVAEGRQAHHFSHAPARNVQRWPAAPQSGPGVRAGTNPQP